jgi:peptidoglycan hydrolase-like protein with peptidoglycan-binding domain
MKISKKSGPGLILAVAAVAAAGIFLYEYKASADEGSGVPGPVPSGGGGGGGGSGDPIVASSGGKLTTAQTQMMLKALGPAAGSSAMASLVVDGKFGPATANAVKSFQSIKGIRVDGIVGPQTADTLANTYRNFMAQTSGTAV